jgi:ABC-type Na+ efflux pump permease subunit
MNGFLAIVRKEFQHVLRDPYALAVATLGTVVIMVLLAYAISADIENIPIVLLDGDLSQESRAYVQRFVNESFFEVRYRAESYHEALGRVQSGEARGAVIVPAGFSDAVRQGRQAQVQIIADGTEPNIALQIMANAEALSGSFSVDLLERRLSRTGLGPAREMLPLEFRVRTLYNPEQRELNTFLPGLMAIVLAFPALSAGLSLVKEREQGSMEGLLSTPIQRHQLLAGKAVPYLAIGLLDILLLTAVGVWVFGIPFRGHIADLMLLSSLFLVANIGVGLLICVLLRTQMAALIVGGLVFMVPLTQSGLITPLYAMSPDARMQAMVWPATHFIIIARGILLKGIGVGALLEHGLFLLGSGVLLNGLAVWRFKKRLA